MGESARSNCAPPRALGIGDLVFLDELDGELNWAEPVVLVARIATGIRRFQPGVVVTFGPGGVYGHPDHIAISRLTSAAVIHAARSNNRFADCA